MKDLYFLEPSLPHKVEEYLREHGRKVNVEIMTEFLIENNKEFHNKKKKFFIKSVTKAYNLVKPNISFDEVNLCEGEEEGNEVVTSAAKNMKRQEFSVDSLYSSPSSESRRLSTNNLVTRVTGQSPRSANQTSLKISEVSNKVCSANSDDNDIIFVGDSVKLRANEFGKVHANVDAVESTLKIAKKKRKKNSLQSYDSEIVPNFKKKKPNSKYETVMPSGNCIDMVGMESLRRVLSYICTNNLIVGNVEKKPSSSKSILLNGPEGSGKSLLITTLAEHYGAKLIKISAKEFLPVFGKPPSEESVLDSVFNHALANGPCILHIENLHHLLVDTGLNKNADSKVITDLVDKINDVNKNYTNKPILIIGELRYQQSQIIDPSLRAIFKKETYIPGLNESERLALLQKFCPTLECDDLKEIAHKTTSYVAGDLVKLVNDAEEFSIMRINDNLMDPSLSQTFKNCIEHYNFDAGISKEDFNEVIKTMTPVLKRSGFPCIPETKMEEIGGLADVKLEIRNKILQPIQHKERFRKYGNDVLHGILLYGPPGCGKTLLAKAIANEAGLNFLIVNSGEMLKMYQGESERAIRENFRLAASVNPCIIFFDEFDCIASIRVGGSEQSGSRQSIVNTLLSEMDGIINRVGVYIMACTNRPDVIDPALLRPGRLDTKLYVGLPDDAGRRSILKAITKDGTLPPVASDVDWAEISSMCKNFSGADLDNLISEAKRRAIDREMKCESEEKTMDFYGITNEDLKCALNKVYPSVSIEDRRLYMQMRSKYKGSFVEKSKTPEVQLKDVSIQVEPSVFPDETS